MIYTRELKKEKKIEINDIFFALKNAKDNYMDIYGKNGRERKLFSTVYKDVLRTVDTFSRSSLTSGCRVGILGTSGYEFVLVDLASVLMGICTVPLDPDYYSNLSDAIAEFELDMLLTNLISIDKHDPKIRTFEEMVSGEIISDFVPSKYEEEDVFTVIFSSGTQGKPKASNVHVKCFADQFTEAVKMYEINEEDKMLVFLPMHIYLERCYIYLSILKGFSVVIAYPNYIIRVLKNAKITFSVGIPSFFETMQDLFFSQSMHNEELKKDCELLISEKENLDAEKISDAFKRFWGGNIRFLLTGSAPCKHSVLKFYHAMNVPLYEGYGMSEIAGMIALNYPNNMRIGSVGKIFPNKKIEFDENQQVLVSGEFVMNNGYLNQTQSVNKSVFIKDHCVATGDVGYLDDEGYLFLTGRINDTIVLSNGKKVHPAYIETKFNKLDIVKNCVVLGTSDGELMVLIVLKEHLGSTNNIKEMMDGINESLPKDERITRFELLNEPFTTENGMLTPSFKLNRSKIGLKYAHLLRTIKP